jgi:hypothetical protein
LILGSVPDVLRVIIQLFDNLKVIICDDVLVGKIGFLSGVDVS